MTKPFQALVRRNLNKTYNENMLEQINKEICFWESLNSPKELMFPIDSTLQNKEKGNYKLGYDKNNDLRIIYSLEHQKEVMFLTYDENEFLGMDIDKKVKYEFLDLEYEEKEVGIFLRHFTFFTYLGERVTQNENVYFHDLKLNDNLDELSSKFYFCYDAEGALEYIRHGNTSNNQTYIYEFSESKEKELENRLIANLRDYTLKKASNYVDEDPLSFIAFEYDYDEEKSFLTVRMGLNSEKEKKFEEWIRNGFIDKENDVRFEKVINHFGEIDELVELNIQKMFFRYMNIQYRNDLYEKQSSSLDALLLLLEKVINQLCDVHWVSDFNVAPNFRIFDPIRCE